jgi:DNA polymerase-1
LLATNKQYIEAYFENYPNVLNYMDSTKELAKEKGFVETVMGRRLYLPQINAKNKMLQQDHHFHQHKRYNR